MRDGTSQSLGASAAPIYVVSGGVGASGGQLVRTALAQFADVDVPVIVVPHVHHTEQLEAVVAQAAATAGTLVHTLVDTDVRHTLTQLAEEQHVPAIDLMGPLLDRLAQSFGRRPLGQPGRYRTLHTEYIRRIEAIEFTVAHDDGRNPHEWELADIVLVGVSRVGKTPLSIYLSMLGWKVANVPLVRELPPPAQLLQIDPGHIVGLTINPAQLTAYRRARLEHLPLIGTAYDDPARIGEELETAQQLFRRCGWPAINVTDRPIEASANTVIALISRRAREVGDRADSSVA
jgi:[pyruvate, water dikinase]-phosphate phosphotransferase / [pyruvate, water dikinase] kinase